MQRKLLWLEWHCLWDGGGSKNLFLELVWLVRNGERIWWRNTNPLIFGAGRLWYDGPHWFLHLGWWSVSLDVGDL